MLWSFALGLDPSRIAMHTHATLRRLQVSQSGSLNPAVVCPPCSAALGGGSNEVASSCNTLLLGCISPLALHLNNTKATLE